MDTASNYTTQNEVPKQPSKNSSTVQKSSEKLKGHSPLSGSPEESTGTVGWVNLPVSKLVTSPTNYKKDMDDPDVVQRMVKLKETIKRRGQTISVAVRELDTGFYEMVDGNHRLDVLRELGIDSAHAWNYGKISEAQAMRLALEMNENLFEADPIKLGERLKELSLTTSIEDLSFTLPYTPDQLGNYIDMTSFNWDDDDKTGEGEDDKDDKDDEDFEAVRIPASLMKVFNKQMKRSRLLTGKGLGRAVTEDEIIAPFETILVMFSKVDDDDIVYEISGGEKAVQPDA